MYRPVLACAALSWAALIAACAAPAALEEHTPHPADAQAPAVAQAPLGWQALAQAPATRAAAAPTAQHDHEGHDHEGHDHEGHDHGSGDPALATTTGTVTALDHEQRRLMLAHDEVPDFNMPAMEMAFEVANVELLEGLQAEQQVRFTFHAGDAPGRFVIVAIDEHEHGSGGDHGEPADHSHDGHDHHSHGDGS